MNVHNIQGSKDLNYVSVLVYTAYVNLMARNANNLKINKNTEVIIYNTTTDLRGDKYARFIARIHDSTKSKYVYNHFEVIKFIHSF